MATSRTWRKPKTLQDTVSAAEASAALKIIFVGTGVPSVATDVFAYNINITRSNIDVTASASHHYDINSGAVVVATNGPNYVLTEDDVINISGTYI